MIKFFVSILILEIVCSDFIKATPVVDVFSGLVPMSKYVPPSDLDNIPNL